MLNSINPKEQPQNKWEKRICDKCGYYSNNMKICCSCNICHKAERQLLLEDLIKKLEGEKVRNDEIDQFKCYNSEGNIRMQDGFNQALETAIKIIKSKI